MPASCTRRRIPRRGFALALAATILTMAAASAPSLFYPRSPTAWLSHLSL